MYEVYGPNRVPNHETIQRIIKIQNRSPIDMVSSLRFLLYMPIYVGMNDNDPLNVGDCVHLRQYPRVQGRVWDLVRGVIVVKWDDKDENAYIRDPSKLQKIS